MSVSFENDLSGIRAPLAYIEFSNARAVQGTPAIPHRILVIGQRLSAGSVSAGEPVMVTGTTQAEKYFGKGSMLAEMFRHLKTANPYTESWAIALDEDADGAAAAGSIDFSGPASAAGTIQLYIAGQHVPVGVASGDSADTIAQNVVDAVNANGRLPVTATVNGTTASQADLTARWNGETGNDIDIRVNYYATEEYPEGVSGSITAMSGGTTNPDISTAIAAMGDDWYHTIVMPYTDSSNLDALEVELDERWGPKQMIDGVAWAAYRDTHSNTRSFGDGRNHHLVTVMGTSLAPQPPYIWASVNAGVAAASLSQDPARPLQTLELTGLMAPAKADLFSQAEREILLDYGIATYSQSPDGTPQVERQITTYQENELGTADTSYLDVTTPYTLSYIRYATRSRITLKFPRHKLASDGARIDPGQAVVTPSVIRSELIALFREMEGEALVEDMEQYKQDLLVERDSGDPNRINVLSPPNLVNQFRVFAAQIQFIL